MLKSQRPEDSTGRPRAGTRTADALGRSDPSTVRIRCRRQLRSQSVAWQARSLASPVPAAAATERTTHEMKRGSEEGGKEKEAKKPKEDDKAPAPAPKEEEKDEAPVCNVGN